MILRARGPVPSPFRPRALASASPPSGLVEVDAQDQAGVLRKVTAGDAVITSVAMMRPLLGPQLRAVTLLGGPRMGFYAARRTDDHRGAVRELLDALLAVPPGTLS